ncbi:MULTISPECIES: GNAT family N-acetyltransferase [unclassified Exiguobacterium]|uniref:GNAT family N-acetyltransferase n=1 Tax=unclassified Exiguobacterium TaxID=2644629 RepID=UPI001BE589A8|nr:MULTISPECIES: GNAT family protein [unclassified Exiguobacterium]
MKTLENEVVKLVPMEISHIEGIWEAANNHEIWEHMSVDLTDKRNVEQYVQDAQKKRAAGTEFAFVIVDIETKKIIGATWFLDISMPHKRLEIGSTWLNPKSWRTNINTNCKFLLLTYCFEELGLNRVQIKTGHENIRSQRAIERIGAIKEGILRNHMIRKEGTIRHTVMYSVTKEDWPQVKERFHKILID